MVRRKHSRRIPSQRRSAMRRRGLTLLEVVLAMGLLVVLSSMTYWFYSSSLGSSRTGLEAAQRLRLVRVVLDRIATEIRQSATVTRDQGVGIRGEPERITITAIRVPSREQIRKRSLREPPPRSEYDLTRVDYKIVRHPEIVHEDGWELPLGLARTEVPIPRRLATAAGSNAQGDKQPADHDTDGRDDRNEGNQAAGTGSPLDGLFGDQPAGGSQPAAGLADQDFLQDEQLDDARSDGGAGGLGPEIAWEELYAPEIRFLRFCYYDGHKWWDTWEISGESPLPQLVRITIGMNARPPFGEETGLDQVNKEFCECMNRDPIDCKPLDDDQFSTVVRVIQADPLFRSRVTRETQSMIEDLSAGGDQGEPSKAP